MTKLENDLKEYGLSEKEAKTYLALLKIGLAKSDQLSSLTRIRRSTIYDLLKSLINKGLAGSVIKEGIRYFEAADPKKLIETLEEKKEKIESIIPELESIKTTVTKKPIIKFYEGKEGLKTILDDVLKAKSKIRIIGNHEKFIESLKWTGESFTKTRTKRKIPVQFIGEISKGAKDLIKRDSAELRQTKTSKELKTVNSELHLYSDKIAIITLKQEQPIGLILEDKEVNKLFTKMYDLLWMKI